MLSIFVLLPLGMATVLSLFKNFSERFHDILVVITLFMLTVLSGAALTDIQSQGMLLQHLGKWPFFPSLALALDGFSAFLLVIVNALLFLLAVYSTGYMAGNEKKTILLCTLPSLSRRVERGTARNRPF